MRILLVSQMYPGPDDPDLGVFVAQLERELVARGHEIERAVLDRRERRQAALPRSRPARARRGARLRPDVVYAHFLVPAGLVAALASRAPLVVTAHGRDVRNVGTIPGIGGRDQVRRSSGRDGRLRLRLPAPRARGEGARGAREGRGRLERRRPRAFRGRAAGPCGCDARPIVPLRRRAHASERTSCVSRTRSRGSARAR